MASQSPDLNPIEYVRAIPKRKLRELSTDPTTKNALFQKLYEKMNNPPEYYFEKPVTSMSIKCTAISNIIGGARKYRVKFNWRTSLKQSMI